MFLGNLAHFIADLLEDRSQSGFAGGAGANEGDAERLGSGYHRVGGSEVDTAVQFAYLVFPFVNGNDKDADVVAGTAVI
jgi:hypothetical protein